MNIFKIICLIIIVVELIYISVFIFNKYKEFKAPAKNLGNETWRVTEIKPDSFWKYLNQRY